MELLRSNRTESITKSEAVKMFEPSASANYMRIVKAYLQFIIDQDLEVSTFSRDLFLQGVNGSSAKVYKSAVNKFLKVSDQFKVKEVKADVHLKRQKLDYSLESLVLLFLSETDVRESSKTTYKKALEAFTTFLYDNNLQVSRKAVQDWKEDLRSRLSAYTVNLYLSAVREFSRFIIEQEDRVFMDVEEGKRSAILKELTRITAVKGLKVEREDFHKDSFTEEEVKQILEGCPDHRIRLIIGLQYFGGLRTVEVTRLKVSDVKDSVLMVKGKGKDVKKAVPVNSALKVLLQAYMNGVKAGDLFPDLSTAMIRHDVNKVLKSVKLKDRQKKASCHSFRHSFVQNLIKKGVPLHQVQALARHSSITTTQGYFNKLQTAGQLAGVTEVLSL